MGNGDQLEYLLKLTPLGGGSDTAEEAFTRINTSPGHCRNLFGAKNRKFAVAYGVNKKPPSDQRLFCQGGPERKWCLF